MNHHYNDIRSRIAEPPRWFDENGVPRYDDFSPRDVANIYAREAVLVRIACQGCGARFDVAFSRDRIGWKCGKMVELPPLADSIRDGSLHYGDPPNIGCCPAGPTMNCDDLRVLEYWRRSKSGFDWDRDGALERPLADGV